MLAEGMAPDEFLELGHHGREASEGDPGVEPAFQRREAELLEAADLGLGERLVAEVGVRCAPPQAERFVESALGGCGIVGQQLGGVAGEAREAACVDGGLLDRQPVGGPFGAQDLAGVAGSRSGSTMERT